MLSEFITDDEYSMYQATFLIGAGNTLLMDRSTYCLLIHQLHLGCFHFLAVMNNAAVNIDVHMLSSSDLCPA